LLKIYSFDSKPIVASVKKPKPARIPPQTPPPRGNPNSEPRRISKTLAEVLQNPFPRK